MAHPSAVVDKVSPSSQSPSPRARRCLCLSLPQFQQSGWQSSERRWQSKAATRSSSAQTGLAIQNVAVALFFQSLKLINLCNCDVTVFCSLNSTIRTIKITARITLCVDSMYVGNKRRRGAAGCLPPLFLSVCVSPFPTWLPARRPPARRRPS